jgi:hypothetical protein
MKDASEAKARRRKWWGYLFAFVLLLGLPIAAKVLWKPSREETADQEKWVDCEDKILTAWAIKDSTHVRERLELIDHYTFAWDFTGFSEYDISRLKATFDWSERLEAAERIGVNEVELIALDQKILRECGRYPQYTDRFPFGRKRVNRSVQK